MILRCKNCGKHFLIFGSQKSNHYGECYVLKVEKKGNRKVFRKIVFPYHELEAI